MADIIPQARFEGYQARSWHKQGKFNPIEEGVHLGTGYTTKGSAMEIRISARLVLELLAGRITQERFQFLAFNKDPNLFERQFRLGMTVKSLQITDKGLDYDDDYMTFNMEVDPAALELRNPKSD